MALPSPLLPADLRRLLLMSLDGLRRVLACCDTVRVCTAANLALTLLAASGVAFALLPLLLVLRASKALAANLGALLPGCRRELLIAAEVPNSVLLCAVLSPPAASAPM